MRQIDTSGITASKGYPLLANNPNATVGLDFIQDLFTDIVTRLGIAIDNQRFTNPMILNGLGLSGNTISAGAMYYTVGGTAGEIFIYNGGSPSGTAGLPYIACSWIPNPTDVSPNQTVLSDGSQVSIHNQRTLTFTYSSTPGNLPNYAVLVGSSYVLQWVPTQIAVNAANIAALQAVSYIPYRNSDRVISGNVPVSETVLHNITVPYNINNLLVFANLELGNTSTQQAVGIKIYVGGTISGHVAGTISGTISGGTVIKQSGTDTDPTYNNTSNITAIVLTNVSAGQNVTVTITGGAGGTPVIENSSDLTVDGSYLG